MTPHPLDFRASLTARYRSSCNFYGLYGISTLENVYLFIFDFSIASQLFSFCTGKNIDKWINTVNNTYVGSYKRYMGTLR